MQKSHFAWHVPFNLSWRFKTAEGLLDICAVHNTLTLGQVLLSMPSLGVSSLDIRPLLGAVFFCLKVKDTSPRYSAASGGACLKW